VGLISRLLGVLGTVWSSKFLPLYLLYKMLKKMNLLYPLLYFSWFMVIVLPSVYGTYAYLLSEQVPKVFAGPATIGIVFGGQFIEIVNAVFTIVEGVTFVEGFVIVLGASTSVLRFLGFYYIFNSLSDAWEATISKSYKFIIGTVILGCLTLLALFIDLYVLTGSSQLSGWTYVLSNPEIITEPVSDLLAQAAADPSTQEALNQSLNNSNVTR